jgi:DNA-binding NtrC family response regulator
VTLTEAKAALEAARAAIPAAEEALVRAALAATGGRRAAAAAAAGIEWRTFMRWLARIKDAPPAPAPQRDKKGRVVRA